MGLLSSIARLARRARGEGVENLTRAVSLGARDGPPSRVTRNDELVMRLLMDNPQATDDDIARLLYGAAGGDVADPLKLARRYRERYDYHMGPNPRTWGT